MQGGIKLEMVVTDDESRNLRGDSWPSGAAIRGPGNLDSGTKTDDPSPLETPWHVVEEPQQHRKQWPMWRHQKKQCCQY